MSNDLHGKRVAILAADGVEEVELVQPRSALESAGATTELISLEPGEIQAMNGDIEPAGTFPVDRTVADADPAQYDALLLPGGTVNPDKLRAEPTAVDFVRRFFQAGQPVAAICHGPLTLIEADQVRGRRLTSFPSIQTDIRNAGGEWVDEEVVTDQGLTTSRSPKDLEAFCAKVVEQFAAAEPAGRSGA